MNIKSLRNQQVQSKPQVFDTLKRQLLGAETATKDLTDLFEYQDRVIMDQSRFIEELQRKIRELEELLRQQSQTTINDLSKRVLELESDLREACHCNMELMKAYQQVQTDINSFAEQQRKRYQRTIGEPSNDTQIQPLLNQLQHNFENIQDLQGTLQRLSSASNEEVLETRYTLDKDGQPFQDPKLFRRLISRKKPRQLRPESSELPRAMQGRQQESELRRLERLLDEREREIEALRLQNPVSEQQLVQEIMDLRRQNQQPNTSDHKITPFDAERDQFGSEIEALRQETEHLKETLHYEQKELAAVHNDLLAVIDAKQQAMTQLTLAKQELTQTVLVEEQNLASLRDQHKANSSQVEAITNGLREQDQLLNTLYQQHDTLIPQIEAAKELAVELERQLEEQKEIAQTLRASGESLEERKAADMMQRYESQLDEMSLECRKREASLAQLQEQGRGLQDLIEAQNEDNGILESGYTRLQQVQRLLAEQVQQVQVEIEAEEQLLGEREAEFTALNRRREELGVEVEVQHLQNTLMGKHKDIDTLIKAIDEAERQRSGLELHQIKVDPLDTLVNRQSSMKESLQLLKQSIQGQPTIEDVESLSKQNDELIRQINEFTNQRIDLEMLLEQRKAEYQDIETRIKEQEAELAALEKGDQFEQKLGEFRDQQSHVINELRDELKRIQHQNAEKRAEIEEEQAKTRALEDEIHRLQDVQNQLEALRVPEQPMQMTGSVVEANQLQQVVCEPQSTMALQELKNPVEQNDDLVRQINEFTNQRIDLETLLEQRRAEYHEVQAALHEQEELFALQLQRMSKAQSESDASNEQLATLHEGNEATREQIVLAQQLEKELRIQLEEQQRRCSELHQQVQMEIPRKDSSHNPLNTLVSRQSSMKESFKQLKQSIQGQPTIEDVEQMSKQNDELIRQVNEFTNQRIDLEMLLEQRKAEYEDIEIRLKNQETELAAIERSELLEQQIGEQRNQQNEVINELREELQRVQEQLADQKSQLKAEQLKARELENQLNQQQPHLQHLLQQGTPTHFETLRQDVEARHSEVDELIAQINQAEQDKVRFEQILQDLRDEIQNHQEFVSDLQQELAAKRESDGENKLAALTQENNNLNQEIEAAEAEKTRLETVLLSVREQVVVLQQQEQITSAPPRQHSFSFGDDFERARERHDSVKQSLQNLKLQLSDVESAASHNDELIRQINEFTNQRVDLELILEQRKAMLHTVQSTVDLPPKQNDIDDLINQINQTEDEKVRFQTMLQALKDEVAELQEEYQAQTQQQLKQQEDLVPNVPEDQTQFQTYQRTGQQLIDKEVVFNQEDEPLNTLVNRQSSMKESFLLLKQSIQGQPTIEDVEQLSKQNDDLIRQINEFTNQRIDLEMLLEQRKAEYQDIETRIKEQEAELAALQQSGQFEEKLGDFRDQQRHVINELREELKRIQDQNAERRAEIEEEQKRAKQYEDALMRVRLRSKDFGAQVQSSSDNDALITRINESEQEKVQLEILLQANLDEIELLKQDIAKANEQYDQFNVVMHQLETRRQEQEDQLEQTRQMGEERLKQMIGEIQQLDDRISRAQTPIAPLSQEVRMGEYEEQLLQNQDLQTQIELLRVQNNKLQKLMEEKYAGTPPNQLDDRINQTESELPPIYNAQTPIAPLSQEGRMGAYEEQSLLNSDLQTQIELLRVQNNKLQKVLEEKQHRNLEMRNALLDVEKEHREVMQQLDFVKESLSPSSAILELTSRSLDPDEQLIRIRNLESTLNAQEEYFNDLSKRRGELDLQVQQVGAQNAELEQLVQQLRAQQDQQVELCLVESQEQYVAEKRALVEQLIRENLGLSTEVADRKTQQTNLQKQLADLEELLMELRMVIADRKKEHTRCQSDNYNLMLRSKKLKAQRDAFFSEQRGLEERLRLLEMQQQELTSEIASVKAIRDEHREELAAQQKQSDDYSSELTELFHKVERQGTEIEEYRDELVTQQAEHKRLNDELRVLRSENAMLSDELQLYRTLKQQDGGLEEVVQALVAKIQTEKEQQYSFELDCLHLQEQCELLAKERSALDGMYEGAREQYKEQLQLYAQQQEDLKAQRGRVEELGVLIGDTEGEVQDLETQLVDRKSERDKLKLQLTTVETECQQLEYLNAKNNTRIDELHRLQRQAEDYDRQHTDLLAKCKALQEQLKERQDALRDEKRFNDSLEERYTDLMARHATELARNDVLQRSLERLIAEVMQAEEQQTSMELLLQKKTAAAFKLGKDLQQKDQLLEKYSMKIIDYEESIPVKEEHIEQLESQLAAIDERLGKLNEEMVRREALEAQVPRLSKEVESTLRRHAELETELHQLRDLEQATSAQMSQLRGSIEQLESELAPMRLLSGELKGEARSLKAQIEEMQGQRGSLVARCEQMETEVTALGEKAKQGIYNLNNRYLEQKRAQVIDASDQLKSLLKQSLEERAELQSQQLQLETSRAHLSHTLEDIASTQGQLRQAQEELAECTQQLREQELQLATCTQQCMQVGDEISHVEAIVAVKERELKQLQHRQGTLQGELQDARAVKDQMIRQIASTKAFVESDDEFDVVDTQPQRELHKRLSFLDVRKRNLLQDLNALVSQQPKSPKEFQDNQSVLEDEIKSKEKRIGILEQTIAQLQNQFVDSASKGRQSLQNSRIITSMFDDNAVLIDLQEQFNRERDLLADLQSKIKQTAERHHELATRLHEYAETEGRMADELEQRQGIVNQIEGELKALAEKQFDLESDKVVAMQRLRGSEFERDALVDEESVLKQRIKEKRDYAAQLARMLNEMDEKLVTLRNKLTLYADEVSMTAQQFKQLEDEKSEQRRAIKSIQSQLDELRSLALEKDEEKARIKAYISESRQELVQYEEQCVGLQGMIRERRRKLGFEETMYARLRGEVDRMIMTGVGVYQGLLVETACQTEPQGAAITVLEEVTNEIVSQRRWMTFTRINELKRKSRHEVAQLRARLGTKLGVVIQQCQDIGLLLQAQDVHITLLESECSLLEEQQPKQQVLEQSEETYTLDSVVLGVSKTMPMKVTLTTTPTVYQLTLDGEIVASHQVFNVLFDADADAYPLGLLTILYNVSKFQVQAVRVTGPRVSHLYSKLHSYYK